MMSKINKNYLKYKYKYLNLKKKLRQKGGDEISTIVNGEEYLLFHVNFFIEHFYNKKDTNEKIQLIIGNTYTIKLEDKIVDNEKRNKILVELNNLETTRSTLQSTQQSTQQSSQETKKNIGHINNRILNLDSELDKLYARTEIKTVTKFNENDDLVGDPIMMIKKTDLNNLGIDMTSNSLSRHEIFNIQNQLQNFLLENNKTLE